MGFEFRVSKFEIGPRGVVDARDSAKVADQVRLLAGTFFVADAASIRPMQAASATTKQRVDDARPEARLLREIGQRNVFPTGVRNGSASMGSSMVRASGH